MTPAHHRPAARARHAVASAAPPALLSRRSALLGLLSVGCGAAVARAADSGRLVPDDLEELLDRGLFYIHKLHKTDGSFESSAPPIASAALAVLAFLAAGHTPDVGRYGQTVRNAVEFMLQQAGDAAYFGRDKSRMYGHAIALVTLSQVNGVELDDALRRRNRQALEKGLKLVLSAQDAKKERDTFVGGWRYEPASTDADLSVTSWCMESMRGCRSVGLGVPRDRFERAMAFVMRCWQDEHHGFGYQPGQAPSAAMTASGMLCVQMLDTAREQVRRGAQFLIQNPVKDDSPFPYYTVFQTTRAAIHAGEKCWTAVWKHNLQWLRHLQRKEDGAWPGRGGNEPVGDDRAGRLYSTVMACLALSVPLRLLPIFQR